MKNAFITGASRGIGREIALSLAEEGYSLILTCHHSKEDLSALKREISEKYPTIPCETILYDCSNPEKVKEVISSLSHLDLLINNAGISYVGLLHEMSVEDWNQVINTNLSSAFYHAKYVIPLMLQKQEGKIINISSVWGNIGASTEVAYSASKGGLNAFTKALAKELAPSNIQVNAIACGFIDTSMNDNLTQEEKNSVVDEIPACRIGTPAEAAEMVLAIIQSPSYLTGQIITLDGAWT